MAVILLKLIFFFVSTLSNLLTRFVFTAAAHVLVQIIQALKVPGENSRSVLEQVRNVITGFLEYISYLLIEAISTIFSTLFDLIKEGVVNSSSSLGAGVAMLLEKSKTSLDNVVEDVPELLEAFREMVGKIVTDLWTNCNEALSYVVENLLK
ncbi:hypothetical protein CDL12_27528 [Handroanthus impetiginosus]|uniref:Uncharacterized protein n=1 Tax=Handroanthus impetiginosus TaxID=429701 RepID=A0A2G9G3U8_9LAMI|nr:hypothetical protein CDL12_27528 [Handroanthus impetiginosus]